jgi:hypothetical protein
MLVHVRENNSRTRKVINFATSNGGDATASSVFLDMLNCGNFADELERWHRAQGLITVPVGTTDTTIILLLLLFLLSLILQPPLPLIPRLLTC